MSESKRTPIRFGLLTALVWLAVAAGIIFLLWQLITRLSASSPLSSSPTPDQTQVNQTIVAIVDTQTTNLPSTPTPTGTPSPTGSPIPPSTPRPSPGLTPTVTVLAITSTAAPLCDQAGAGNPLDVTIPDDSQIPAGQSFTKTWKLVNVGTCTWTTSYSVSFFYGDRMGAPTSLPLDAIIDPNQSVEISVEMVAPQSPGTYQGNWKMANAAGALFGIGPDGNLPFWVRIVVPENLATATRTPGITPSANPSVSPSFTPTSTSTPPGQVSGELSVNTGESIDLDTITLDGAGADLRYQVDENNIHWLTPAGGAILGIFGDQDPTQADCQSASMSPAPIPVESLPVGTYLCYTTNQSRLGKALMKSLDPADFTLTLDLLTWALP